MGCSGNVNNCTADAFLCPCGVLMCEVHGHADVGDDPYCPHWLPAETLDETKGRGYEDIDLSRWDDGGIRQPREGDDGTDDHRFRTDLSLEMDGPQPRAIEPPDAGAV
jgi:hypothetical protein